MGACYSDGPNYADPQHCRNSTLKFDQPSYPEVGCKINGATSPQPCYPDEAASLPPWANQKLIALADAEFSGLEQNATLPAPPCFLAMRPMMTALELLLPPTAPDWMHELARRSKVHDQNLRVFKLQEETRATLQVGSMRQAVLLPPGVDRDEWLAAQTVSVFEEVFQFVSLMDEVCSPSACPTMRAGTHVVFKWYDEDRSEPVRLSALEYMRTLIEYADKTLCNLIPKEGQPFPPDFFTNMQKLHTRFFRVYAHAYIHHFDVIRCHGADGHLNCCFKRLLFLSREFNLVSDEDLALLRGLVEEFDAAAAPCITDGFNARPTDAPSGDIERPESVQQAASTFVDVCKQDPRRATV